MEGYCEFPDGFALDKKEYEMEVKIGVTHSPKEIALECDTKSADIEKTLLAALKDGSPFKLTDTKGRTVIIPSEKVAYIECGIPTERKVGFAVNS